MCGRSWIWDYSFPHLSQTHSLGYLKNSRPPFHLDSSLARIILIIIMEVLPAGCMKWTHGGGVMSVHLWNSSSWGLNGIWDLGGGMSTPKLVKLNFCLYQPTISSTAVHYKACLHLSTNVYSCPHPFQAHRSHGGQRTYLKAKVQAWHKPKCCPRQQEPPSLFKRKSSFSKLCQNVMKFPDVDYITVY
jgi:hypothetical protein